MALNPKPNITIWVWPFRVYGKDPKIIYSYFEDRPKCYKIREPLYVGYTSNTTSCYCGDLRMRLG